MIPLVAYLLLFVAIGIGFILVNLLVGKIVRPNLPGAEKKTIYECGEPTIGSAWIQFDLRFYVVALLFVIFDVEVAFFFPWAEVFGKANNVAALSAPAPDNRDQLRDYGKKVNELIPNLPQNEAERNRYSELTTLDEATFRENQQDARRLSVLALAEIAVFFGVLLVGFAYLWKRGDLAWVRSTAAEQTPTTVAQTLPPSGTKQLIGAGS
jgi:NADH-quinone oxidoreductase subunit A